MNEELDFEDEEMEEEWDDDLTPTSPDGEWDDDLTPVSKEEELAVPPSRYVVSHEGRVVEIPLEVGRSDEKTLRLLASWLPQANQSTLVRSKPDQEGTQVISLQVKAAPKG